MRIGFETVTSVSSPFDSQRQTSKGFGGMGFGGMGSFPPFRWPCIACNARAAIELVHCKQCKAIEGVEAPQPVHCLQCKVIEGVVGVEKRFHSPLGHRAL